ncbi:MAG TPA: hypothetical protein VGR57_00755 [Ktedonobacterales bacterium]|nr:hypothetical protein [Ktedonobacterales bacterium]
MPLARKVSSAGAALLLIGLIGVGCGAPTAQITPDTGQPATATAAAGCSTTPTETLSPPPQIPFALPPDTVSRFTSGAAGAGFWVECTPGATGDAITSFLNSELPGDGWQRWDPRTQNANGCGTEANDFWRWWKGGSAVGWSFETGPALPTWGLVFCDLAFGR